MLVITPVTVRESCKQNILQFTNFRLWKMLFVHLFNFISSLLSVRSPVEGGRAVVPVGEEFLEFLAHGYLRDLAELG